MHAKIQAMGQLLFLSLTFPVGRMIGAMLLFSLTSLRVVGVSNLQRMCAPWLPLTHIAKETQTAELNRSKCLNIAIYLHCEFLYPTSARHHNVNTGKWECQNDNGIDPAKFAMQKIQRPLSLKKGGKICLWNWTRNKSPLRPKIGQSASG